MNKNVSKINTSVITILSVGLIAISSCLVIQQSHSERDFKRVCGQFDTLSIAANTVIRYKDSCIKSAYKAGELVGAHIYDSCMAIKRTRAYMQGDSCMGIGNVDSTYFTGRIVNRTVWVDDGSDAYNDEKWRDVKYDKKHVDTDTTIRVEANGHHYVINAKKL